MYASFDVFFCVFVCVFVTVAVLLGRTLPYTLNTLNAREVVKPCVYIDRWLYSPGPLDLSEEYLYGCVEFPERKSIKAKATTKHGIVFAPYGMRGAW